MRAEIVGSRKLRGQFWMNVDKGIKVHGRVSEPSENLFDEKEKWGIIYKRQNNYDGMSENRCHETRVIHESVETVSIFMVDIFTDGDYQLA